MLEYGVEFLQVFGIWKWLQLVSRLFRISMHPFWLLKVKLYKKGHTEVTNLAGVLFMVNMKKTASEQDFRDDLIILFKIQKLLQYVDMMEHYCLSPVDAVGGR